MKICLYLQANATLIIIYSLGCKRTDLFLWPTTNKQLTKGLQWLHQSEGEIFVFRQLFEHAGNFVVSYSNYVASINALNVVTDTDDFHPIHHTALFYTLPGEKDNEWLTVYKTLK